MKSLTTDHSLNTHRFYFAFTAITCTATPRTLRHTYESENFPKIGGGRKKWLFIATEEKNIKGFVHKGTKSIKDSFFAKRWRHAWYDSWYMSCDQNLRLYLKENEKKKKEIKKVNALHDGRFIKFWTRFTENMNNLLIAFVAWDPPTLS